MLHQIKFGSKSITLDLEYRKRKSLSIRVHPSNKVEVLAPFAANEELVFETIRRKLPWILKQIDQFDSYHPLTPAKRFINGETHLYLGRQYRLKIVPDIVDAVKAHRGFLWMHSQNPTPEALQVQLNKWYKEKATILFKELLHQVLPKFKLYKISEPELKIRAMSKRWGSCTSSGRISLNPELVKAPKGCIEYVVVHELCHLIHYDHTQKFIDLQTKKMKDWQKWKMKLENLLA